MTMRVRLIDLGLVSPVRSQTVYHAVGYCLKPGDPGAILLVSSDRPYVSIGYHQEAEKEVDLQYCQAAGLPVVRREVGGGAVYLDSGQVFCQWVFQPDMLPPRVEDRFALYARPIVETYRSLGVEAYYRPVNDIHVSGRKIGGLGAARLGRAEVVVGSLMFTFDKQTMARVVKVSSEKMRDKVYESLQMYMTTLAEQLGYVPAREQVLAAYLDRCRVILGCELVPGELTPEELAMAEELDRRFASEEWLCLKGGLRQTGVKIHADVRIVEAAYKAPGGLVRVTARLHRDRIEDITLSGDFTVVPAAMVAALEQMLRGTEARPEAVLSRLEKAYQGLGLQAPGLSPQDLCQAIMAATGTTGPH